MTANELRELKGQLADVEERLHRQPDAKAQMAFQARYYCWLVVVASRLASELERLVGEEPAVIPLPEVLLKETA